MPSIRFGSLLILDNVRSRFTGSMVAENKWSVAATMTATKSAGWEELSLGANIRLSVSKGLVKINAFALNTIVCQDISFYVLMVINV